MSNKAKTRMINILLVVFILIFLGSGFLLARYIWNSHKQQGKFDNLADLVAQAQTTEMPTENPSSPAPAPTEAPGPDYVTVVNPETGEEVQVLPEYADIYKMNPDTVGWMRLEDTKINYPVMQSPEYKDFYLHKNFEKQYSAHGCFYVREVCDVFRPSDNLTIYGHNMRDGSMMAALHKFESEDFWKEHHILTFDTLKEHHNYEIFAVFVTSASENKGFPYHEFVDAENEAQYDHFVQTCKDLSFYDTGITPRYGEKLITLSTCDYTVENGRLVVVARQIPTKP